MTGAQAPLVRRAVITSAILLGISLTLRLVTSFRKAYAPDDFYWAYLAWLRSTPLVPGRDYYLPNLTPLAEFAAPLFRWFPESFAPMVIARAINLFVGLALIWTTYRVARLLGGSVIWGLIAANVLSWQFQFMKRIGDIRSDQMAAVCLMLAVIAILNPAVRRKALWAGLASGIAVALTYKVVLAGPFILLALSGASSRRVRDAVTYALSAAVAPVLYFGSRVLIDGGETVWSVFHGVSGALSSGLSYRWPVFATALYTSPVTWIAFAAGFAGLLRSGANARAYALLATAFLVVFVFFNAFLFQYNYVIIVPIVAPMVTGVPALLPGERLAVWAMFLVPIAAAGGGTFALDDILNTTCDAQESAIHWVWKTTARDEAFFDWQGCVAWRPSTYHWWLYSGVARRYRAGWFSAEQEIRRAQVKIVLPNLRLQWMTDRDTAFLRTHFVEADTCIFVPGWIVTRAQLMRGASIDAFLRDEEYVTTADVRGVLIDGLPLAHRQRIPAGRHVLSATAEGQLPDHIALMRLTPSMEATAPPCRGQLLIDPSS